MELDGRDPACVARAAEALAAGRLFAFPTETVYGLGARADDDDAVSRIFATKGRPADHPLIVHVAEAAHAATFCGPLSPTAQRLTDAFWPGPLTIIVQRLDGVANRAAGGHATLGLRCPAHPIAHTLIMACLRLGIPGIAAPSANRFGRVSPTRAAHVVEEFGDMVDVLDGGECSVGIESSIIDCSGPHAALLRPGMLTRERIESVLGTPLMQADATAARAPGTLEAHYAPQAKVRLMTAQQLETALQLLGGEALKLAVYSRSLPAGFAPGLIHRRMPLRPEAAAHELFAALREFDAMGVQLIWVERPPDDSIWDGVRDRLQRAAAS